MAFLFPDVARRSRAPSLDTVLGCVFGDGCVPGALMGPTRWPGASLTDFQGRGDARTKAWLCGGSGV